MEYFKTAAILCGGKSSRMGFDKSRLKIGDKLLIDIIKDDLDKIFDEVVYISNDKSRFDYEKVYQDVYGEAGPAGAIYTALIHAKSKYVFVTACDMPFVNKDYILYMKTILSKEGYDCVITKKGQWIEPLFAFYSVDMIEIFRKNIEDKNFKLFEIIKESRYYVVDEEYAKLFSPKLDMFYNLNYKEDITLLKNILKK